MHQQTPELGKLIEGIAFRDAIHVAVTPAIAGHNLTPGEHVGFIADGQLGTSDTPIGIVDPYLRHKVCKGQEFWLCLYPNTVTSLRHAWTHPAFPHKKG